MPLETGIAQLRMLGADLEQKVMMPLEIAHAWSRAAVHRQPRLLNLVGKLLFVDLDFDWLAAQQLTSGP